MTLSYGGDPGDNQAACVTTAFLQDKVALLVLDLFFCSRQARSASVLEASS
jgi:hypothetical protein